MKKLRLGAVVAVLISGLTFLPAAPAFADGPEIVVTKTAAGKALVGTPLRFSLSATNPTQAGAVAEYNLTFRDELPVGLSYVPGSGSFGDPRIVVDGIDGHETLIWDNVSDLPVSATTTLTFTAEPDPSIYPVGATVANTGSAYSNSDPRLLAKFDANGDPVAGSFTESGTSGPTSTEVIPLTLAKSEASPGNELVRGVHDHVTTYTLTVTNNPVAATNNVVVVDYLPAELEFLGCGDVDNSAGVEYLGAPRLDGVPDLTADCVVPDRIETVQNPAGLPAGVYTRLEWDLGAFPAGLRTPIKYLAGIPQLANTTTFPGGAPAPTSLAQGANLDNNTGASTRELGSEAVIRNRAVATGTYTGPTAPGAPPASDNATQAVSIEDVSMQKAVSPGAFSAGGVAAYTLTVNISEYADADGIVITDLLPDGLCPLSTTTNYAPGAPAECGPGGAFTVDGASYAGVVANPDGTYEITFTPLSGVANDVLTITYRARMRTQYGSDGHPTAAGDGYTNTATLTGSTTPAPGVDSPDTGVVGVTDDAAATLTSDAARLQKTIMPDVTPITCSTSDGDYLDPAAEPGEDWSFREGSRVCFHVRVDFATDNHTRNPTLTDFLPDYVAYEPGSLELAAGSEPATLVTAEPLQWEIGTAGAGGRYVPPGSFFDVKFSGIVQRPGPGPAPDITANLAKLRWANSADAVFALRDQADFAISPAPPLTVDKSAARLVGVPTGSLSDGSEVRADQVLEYTVAVTSNGSAAADNDIPVLGPDVWDALPLGVTCAEVSTISDGGQCTDPGDTGHPTFTGRATQSAIRWELPDTVTIAPGATLALTYRMQVPSDASVSQQYLNRTAVASYATESNIGTLATHFPASNIDTTVPADQLDAPAAADDFTVVVPGAGIAKTNETSVDEVGNALAQRATIGEQVTYTVTATAPAHTSLYDAVLSDPLPPGLVFGSATAELSTDGGGSFGALPPGFVLDAGTGTVTFPGTYQNSSGTDHVVRVTLVARVADVTGNSHGVNRTNTATLRSNLGAGGTALPPVTASSPVRVVEPAPTLTKTDDDADNVVTIGQPVVFRLTAGNATGRPPLHDVFVVDCVPAEMTVTGPLAGSPSSGSVGIDAGDGTNGCPAGTTRIVWSVGDLAGGGTETLDYTAEADPTAAGGQAFTNTATLTGSTLDDGKAGPLDADNPVERSYTRTASDTLTVAGATMTKDVAEATRTIGQRATYTLSATLPADVNFFDAAVTDTLPAGLDLATLQTVSVDCTNADSSTCAVDGSPLAPSGRTVGWLLGDLTSSSQQRTVTIVYAVVVADLPSNTAGTALTNTAEVRWDLVDGADPASAGDTWDEQSPSDTATVTVAEPSLGVTKSVSDPTPEPGQVFAYQVVVSNASGATRSAAHDVTVVDTVPDGVVVDPLSISDGGVLTGAGPSGGGTITWTVPGPIAPGASRTLTYDAELASPAPTGSLTNTADITEYFSLPGAGGRQYDGPSTQAPVTAALPHVDVQHEILMGDTAYIDEPKTWQITITSNGDSTAYGVDAQDVLPPSWTYDTGTALVSVNGGPPVPVEPVVGTAGNVQTLTWNDLADLPVGQTIVITFSATPGPGVVADPGVGASIDHVSTASTTAEDAEGNQGPAGGGSYHGPPDTAIAHIGSADLSLTKAHSGPAVAGTDFSWTLLVANDGPDPAAGPFTVTDTLPAEVTPGTVAGTGWSCSTTGVTVTCTRTNAADTLAAGSSFPPIQVTVGIPADLPADTDLTNTASGAAKTYDPDPTDNDDTDSVTVTAEADLAIAKALSGPLVAGQRATYTLDVTNLGPSVSRGEITVTDLLPAGVGFADATGPGWDCTEALGVVTCTRSDDVPLGSLPQIVVTIDVPPSQTADLVNTASVAGPLDPNPDNDDDSVTTTPSTSADLALVKRSVGTLVAGENGTYRFTVTNNGPSDAQPPVAVADTLPATLTYVDFSSVTGVWTCGSTGQDVTCTLTGALAAGDTAAVEITVAVDPDNTDPITNTARVTSATPDPVPANDTSTDSTDVDARADLVIAKTHTGTPVAGGQVTYDLSIRNAGPSRSPATITVVDTLPAGMSFTGSAGAGWSCSAAGQVVTCDLGSSLGAGATAPTLSITADIASDAGPATLTNTATVTGPLPDPTPDNNSASDPTDIVDRANISVVKTVTGANPVVAGTTTEFEITVHNDGPSDADAVVVADTLPAGMTLVSASGTGWTCTGVATITCARPTVAAGVDAPVITVVARVDSGLLEGSPLRNVADVSTATGGDDPSDNSDAATVDVVAEADLALTIVHDGGPVVAGETTSFTVQVTNNGPSDAQGPLTVELTLPPGMSYVSVGGDWTCTAVGQDVTCTLLDGLAAGADAPPLQFVVAIDADVSPGDLTIDAIVSSPTTDPVPGNNPDSVTVPLVAEADLSITKAHVGDGLVGEELSFTLDVRNAGPSEARNVVATDTLPTGLEFVSAGGTGWSCGETDGAVTCAFAAPLAPDEAAPTITVVVLVRPEAYPGSVNVATVSSDATERTPADNTASDPVVVLPLVNLTIEKVHTGDFTVGGQGEFLIQVVNAGPTPDPGPVTVTDVLPEGLSFVSGVGPGWDCTEAQDTVTCTHGALGVGAAASFVLVVDVGPAAYPTVTNTAVVTTAATETASDDNSAEDTVGIIPLVVLDLEKRLVSTGGGAATYDLVLSNRGPNDTVGATKVVDRLPTGLALLSAAGPGWTCVAPGRVVTCTTTQTLEAGDSSTIRLTARITASPGSTVVNTARASGGGSVAAVESDAAFTVPSTSNGALPDTGGPSLAYLWGGLVAILVGTLLLLVSRRRRD